MIKYIVLGDPSYAAGTTGNSCESYTSGLTANNNLGADSMATIYAHELVETVSNVIIVSIIFFISLYLLLSDTLQYDGNGWHFSNGFENADNCAWTFSPFIKGFNNRNVIIGNKYWLIQRNWLPKYGCTLSN